MAKATSLLAEHLKDQFWISSNGFHLLQTLNGALLLREAETGGDFKLQKFLRMTSAKTNTRKGSLALPIDATNSRACLMR